MGTTTPRYWDSREYDSRPARGDDPPSEVFEAYIPHPISGWAPDLNARTWHRVAAATQRCRDLQHGAAGPLPAEWLLERAESIASSSIEGIRPSARKVARAEARLALFGQQPADNEMQALRNISITAEARELAASGAALSVDGLRRLHETLMGEDPVSGRIRDRQKRGVPAAGAPPDQPGGHRRQRPQTAGLDRPDRPQRRIQARAGRHPRPAQRGAPQPRVRVRRHDGRLHRGVPAPARRQPHPAARARAVPGPKESASPRARFFYVINLYDDALVFCRVVG